MSRVIGVSSGKGGVGKTTCTINLGAALASLGKSVAIVDASLTTPDISLHLGVPFHMHSLSHVLQGNSHIHAATFNHKSGVKIIPGNIHVDFLKEFEGESFRKVLRDLAVNHDFVLVDCAAGLGREALSALKHCKEAIVVANPDLPSVVNAAKTIRVCEDISCKPIGVILNKTSSKQQLAEEKIIPLFNRVQIIGKVPDDKKFTESLKASEVLFLQHSDSKPAQKFLTIAGNLVENNRKAHVTLIPALEDKVSSPAQKVIKITVKRKLKKKSKNVVVKSKKIRRQKLIKKESKPFKSKKSKPRRNSKKISKLKKAKVKPTRNKTIKKITKINIPIKSKKSNNHNKKITNRKKSKTPISKVTSIKNRIKSLFKR